MTRDEAIKAFRNSTPNPSSFSDEAWIDRFVALGMLKLDEPKPIGIRLGEALKPFGIQIGVYEMEAIDAAGLKIVEK